MYVDLFFKLSFIHFLIILNFQVEFNTIITQEARGNLGDFMVGAFLYSS